MAKIKNNNTNLASVRSKLKTGEVTRIAERTGFSTSYVSAVLHGRRNNETIVSTAKALTKGRK